MKSAFELRIFPNKTMIPVATSALKAYADTLFDDSRQSGRLVLALEEAIGNILFFSGSRELGDITVRVGTEGSCFIIDVLDDGLPGNFDQTLSGDDALGLTLMRNCVDKLIIENLGTGGRLQRMIKYMASVPQEILLEKPVEEEPLDASHMTFSIREPRMSDLLEVSRGMYREYGLGYYHDNAYIPELFMDAIKKGEIRSIVSVNEDGLFAGHHAFWEWSDLPGVYESGMAVVNPRLRGAGVFGSLMENTRNYYLNVIQKGAYLGYSTTYHVYSQKGRLKTGSTPFGFALNFAPEDVCSNNKDNTQGRHSYAIGGEIHLKEHRTVYLPEEVVDTVRFIYDGQQLPRSIITEGGISAGSRSRITGTMLSRLHAGHICAHELGEDAARLLLEDVHSLRRQGAEVMEIFISTAKQDAIPFYEEAKKLGFFFCGLIPGADDGDLLYMTKPIKGLVNYEHIATTGPYTELLERIKRFDPDLNR